MLCIDSAISQASNGRSTRGQLNHHLGLTKNNGIWQANAVHDPGEGLNGNGLRESYP